MYKINPFLLSAMSIPSIPVGQYIHIDLIDYPDYSVLEDTQNAKSPIAKLTTEQYGTGTFFKETVLPWCKPNVDHAEVNDFLSCATNKIRDKSLMERVDALFKLKDSLDLQYKDQITAQINSSPQESGLVAEKKVKAEVRFDIGRYFCVIKETITETEAACISELISQMPILDEGFLADISEDEKELQRAILRSLAN